MSMAMSLLQWLTERLSKPPSFYWGSGTATCQRLPERAPLRHRPPTAVAGQQLLRAPGQQPPDLPPLAFYPGDHHAVVAGRLVPQPGDHRRLGPPPDRDAPGPGDRAAADRRGMVGDGPCQAVGKVGVSR